MNDSVGDSIRNDSFQMTPIPNDSGFVSKDSVLELINRNTKSKTDSLRSVEHTSLAWMTSLLLMV